MKALKFDNKPLVDSTDTMQFPVLSLDLAAAEAVKSGSVNSADRFKECVLAQACIRTFGQESKVRVMRRTAWVSMPNEKFARRYEVSPEAYEVLSAFDRGDKVTTGLMVTFIPPTPSRQLKAMRKYADTYRKQHGRSTTNKTGRKQTKTDALQGVVRNGTYVKL